MSLGRSATTAPSLRRRAVFLDRDGVLIEPRIIQRKPYAVRTVEEIVLMAGVHDACRTLRAVGYRLIMFTNQPEVARGTLDPAELVRMNQHIAAQLLLDDVKVCPHDDAAACACRKPKPGMLLRAAQDMDLELKQCFVVGDRWRDIEAGQAAGCHTVLIDRGYDERRVAGDWVVSSLPEAVPMLVDLAINAQKSSSPAGEPIS